MNTKAIRLFLIILISVLFGYAIGVTNVKLAWLNYHPQVSITSKEPPAGMQTLDMQKFWTVLDKLQTMYYDPTKLNSQKILDGAINGMVNSVDDPFTLYLPAQQNSNFKQTLSGQFQGIGAELGTKDKQIIVIAPLDGSPALKAGLKPGDTILKVDNQEITGWDLSKVVDIVKGPKGTKVTLNVLHKDTKQPVDITITRDAITIKSVAGWTKAIKDIPVVHQQNFTGKTAEKVAYIALAQFGDNTDQEWVAVTNKISMSMQTDKSIKGVILDLRNNPGGYLTDAVFIAGEFIKSGAVVYEDDGKGNKTPMNVARKGLLTDVPLVVLINKGSASAAEIVSGALRDHGRAKLIGETSFGKGTVQEAEDLGDGAGLHVTVAKWLTPNSTWVGNGKGGTGLVPDITVKEDTKDPTHDAQLEKAIQELVQ